MLGSPRSWLASAATTWLPNGLSFRWRYGSAVVITCVAILAGAALHPLVPERIFITLFPAVAAISLISGLVPAMVAALIMGHAAIIFWMPPVWGWPEHGPALSNLFVFLGMSAIIAGLGHLVRQLVSEVRTAEAAAELRAAEMNHRIQNIFNVIVALGRGAVPKDDPVAQEFWSNFEGRLRGLSSAQHLILKPEKTAELEPLLRRVLAGHDQGRFVLQGPSCKVVNSTLLVLGIHELATNALKYGALSVESGTVQVKWSIGPSDVTIEWTEIGGPPVVAPIREGFGSKVLKSLNATRTFNEGGVRTTFQVPLA